jgi:hypothetical protein
MFAARLSNLSNGSNQYKEQCISEGVARVTPSQPTRVTVAQAAALAGVDKRTVLKGRKVLHSGDEELIAAVDSGKMTVNAANQVANEPDPEVRTQKTKRAIRESRADGRRERGRHWRTLRQALDLLTSLPNAADIVNAVPHNGVPILARKLPQATRWLGDFNSQWSNHGRSKA